MSAVKPSIAPPRHMPLLQAKAIAARFLVLPIFRDVSRDSVAGDLFWRFCRAPVPPAAGQPPESLTDFLVNRMAQLTQYAQSLGPARHGTAIAPEPHRGQTNQWVHSSIESS